MALLQSDRPLFPVSVYGNNVMIASHLRRAKKKRAPCLWVIFQKLVLLQDYEY